MAAHALTIAARLARYDAAPCTPPRVMAEWLRLPPSTRWAVLDVLCDAGAAATIDRIDRLERHVLAAEWTHGPYSASSAPFEDVPDAAA